MKRLPQRSRREPTISLINIVFLILVFFMVTGTLTQPSLPSLEFVQTTDLDCCTDGRVLQVNESGGLFVSGEEIGALNAYLGSLPEGERVVRITPDRRLPARELLRIVSELRAEGVENIYIITENAGP
ncbi:MAG: biopolymer transporter ExbD [Pseudomonadota bacterium]